MTLRPNRDWGEVGPLPTDAVIAATDREVGRLVEDAWQQHAPLPPVALVGGDLRRAMGGRRDRDELRRDTEVFGAAIDVGAVVVEGRRFAFVAHVIARSRWWSGPLFAVMNSEFLDDWIVAPRAHPGDGYFDLVEARLVMGDRLKARRRLPTGTHVPHPSINVRKITTADLAFGVTRSIHVDGECIGNASAMRVECHRGALHAYV